MKVTIEKIEATQTFGSGFTKREFIGVDNSSIQYPQPIKFEVVKDKCSELDDFRVGQEVNVEFNIRGNRWTNKEGKEVIFNSLSVWKIEAIDAPQDITPTHDGNKAESDIPNWMKGAGGVAVDESDLPF